VQPLSTRKRINMETTICINETTDYSIFKAMNGNRKVNLGNVRRIVASKKIKDLPVPIIVNEKMEVIDGQHRLAACKELGTAVKYIVAEGLTLEDVQRMNTNMHNWGDVDYLQSYVDRFNAGEERFEDYKRLEEFMKEYEFGIGSAITLLTLGDDYKETHQNFQDGEFLIDDLGLAMDIVYQLSEVTGLIYNDKLARSRAFIDCYFKFYVSKKFNFQTLLRGLDKGYGRNVTAVDKFEKLSGSKTIEAELTKFYNCAAKGTTAKYVDGEASAEYAKNARAFITKRNIEQG